MTARIQDFITELELVDHHVHGVWVESKSRTQFETTMNEASGQPAPQWMSYFDSQIGFAIRRHCAQLLDLTGIPSADDYWAARDRLGEQEIAVRMTRAAGVSDWIVDTGNRPTEITSPDGLADISGDRAHEIVRLESLAVEVARRGVGAAGYADEFCDLLATATKSAVGVKSIAAYRCGFDIDWSRPDAARVTAAADSWLADGDEKLSDPVLIRFGVYAAADRGLPIQFHTGYGDIDVDLHRANPILLLDLLRQPDIRPVPVTLLHTYPYQREAGYLAQAFDNVYFDVGLGLNYLGVRSQALLAESLELAPFAKILYSSDAFGPAELHYLGATLWRAGLASLLGSWVDAGEWTQDDAERVARLIGRDNARRVYGL